MDIRCDTTRHQLRGRCPRPMCPFHARSALANGHACCFLPLPDEGDGSPTRRHPETSHTRRLGRCGSRWLHRHKTIDYWLCFRICGSVVDWQSKRQATVSHSPLESEYIALAEATRATRWLRSLLAELDFGQSATLIHCGNQGAIRLADNPGTHARTKHIDNQHHAIREMVEEGTIELEYVKSDDQ